MRGPALLVVFVVGCITRSQSIDEPDPDPGLPDEPGRCRSDSQCAPGWICARTRSCSPPDQIRAVSAEWTLRGMVASMQTCATARDLIITFLEASGGGRVQSFAPVPCSAGKFSIDKLPMTFDRVELVRESGDQAQRATIDATGIAKLDLPY